MAVQVQLRGDIAANWTATNPILASRELGIETDTNKFKIGNGVDTWNVLPYGGIQGIYGTQGLQGLTGLQGLVGAQGLQGITGSQGIDGLQGLIGYQGITGLQGVQGTTGSQGLQGILGLQGIQGLQGTIGLQGIQGITGSQGLQGITGIQGTYGLQGLLGLQGIQGVQSVQGIQGVQGVTPNGKRLLSDAVADHDYLGTATNIYASGYTAAAFDLVFMGSSSKWLEADANAAATAKGMLGIAMEAKNDTQAMLVALSGTFIRDESWNWNPSAPLYVSGTLGGITETPPTAEGADTVIRCIGHAVTAKIIYFDVSNSYQTTVA